MCFNTIPFDWKNLLALEFEKPYFHNLTHAVNEAYKCHTIFPPNNLVFNALQLSSFNNTKVVIIGQDPYHKAGQANGLSFSVNDGVRIPPSLKNIFKELKTDIPGFEIPVSGNLEAWAKQGILMLNAVLTVEEGLAGSHKNFGWQHFTDAIIKLISEKKENIVFLLWGNYAIEKEALILNKDKHKILTAAHPSPLARGAFFGCQHFSKTNTYLVENGLSPIIWNLTY
ncbi:MAG: uracil-DNA glycosylase [Bacteroidota bacterium]|nr:uracil-DNA glycosylase [Bacteroidota bacterium]MDP3145791.1 uracil-DNA glycosylase [Bacteroidota bacterium]MDP3558425.1 uracil-DNA glycosylase [Bacteroidota bacterium]